MVLCAARSICGGHGERCRPGEPARQNLPGQLTLRRMTAAYVAVASRSRDSQRLVQEARAGREIARRHASETSRRAPCRTFESLSESLSASISSVGRSAPWNLTFVADLAVDGSMRSGRSIRVMETAVRLHPGRWRFDLTVIPIAGASGEGSRCGLLDIGRIESGHSAASHLRTATAKSSRRVAPRSSAGRRLADKA